MRIVTVSTLYPNDEFPSHGIFVETRLRHLCADTGYAARVIAPTPYFPSRGTMFGRFGQWGRVAPRETRFEIDIRHPRYLVVPGVSHALTPALLYRAMWRGMQQLHADGFYPELIDAHYLYPDGVAAARLAAHFGLPFVMTARGSDVTAWPQEPGPARQIRAAIARADHLIAVSAALAEGLGALGAAPGQVTVLRNGVDLARFMPIDPEAARRAVGQARRYVLSVGHLIPRKGHDRVIRALGVLRDAGVKDIDVLIIGSGPEEARLRSLAASLGLAEHVRLIGAIRQEDLARFYSGADMLVLASSREGWANVLLESMACGTPVVASPAPGNAEVVREAAAGLVASHNTPEALAQAMMQLWATRPERVATLAFAARHDWRSISLGQATIFEAVRARHPIARR
jgi:glycosyltransferase involved in cell wall biosynthesis